MDLVFYECRPEYETFHPHDVFTPHIQGPLKGHASFFHSLGIQNLEEECQLSLVHTSIQCLQTREKFVR